MPTKLQLKPLPINNGLFSYSPYRNNNAILVYNNSILINTTRQPSTPIRLPDDSKRGQIQEFSRKSRFRMLKLLSEIHLQSYQSSIFITLTYHNLFPTHYSDLKYQLKKFLTALKRHYPSAAIVWRVELQKRGAPHFHLFLFSTKHLTSLDISKLKKSIQQFWFSAINNVDEYMLKYSVDVKEITNHQQVFAYISKYIGKTINTPAESYIGRRWGYTKNLIRKEVEMLTISNDLLNIFTENLLNWLDSRRIIDDAFRDYINTSSKVQVLIPIKDFYIIFEKSLEQYRTQTAFKSDHKDKLSLEFRENTLLQKIMIADFINVQQ